jgi:DnaJ domain
MKTLYDLLGALPHDDAEELRIAFRRAVKGAHPDVRPGDPDAALKFREIVRANEILGDAEQRAVYDDLLELAQLEQTSATAGAPAGHRIITGLIALGAASAVTAASYLVFMYMSAASVASVINFNSADVSPSMCERPGTASEPTIPATAIPNAYAEGVRVADAGEAPGLASGAAPLQPPGISAFGGDLKSRIADLDQSLQPGTKPLPAYVDPGVVFYRTAASDRAFPDLAPAKRIEKPGRTRSARAKAGKLLMHRVAIATGTPVSRRTAAQDASRYEGPVVMLR